MLHRATLSARISALCDPQGPARVSSSTKKSRTATWIGARLAVCASGGLMRTLSLCAALCLFAAVGGAQTNDHVFRAWSWLSDPSAPRVAGLGGAFVGLADDSAAVFTNPAGIVTLPKNEIALSVLQRGAGSFAIGDATSSRTSLGFVGGVVRLSEHFALGGYITEPHDERITLALGTPAGSNESGFLQTTVTDVGVAVGWQPAPRLSVGGRVNVTHLRLQALAAMSSGQVGMAAGQNRLAGDAGILFKASDRLSVGAAFTQGARWDVDRTAVSPSGASLASGPYQLSSPSVLASGAAFKPSSRVTLVGQAELVLLSRLKDTFQAVNPVGSRDSYVLDNAVDLRGGVEFSIPRGRTTVQLRGGVYSQGSSSFQYNGPGTEAQQFVGVTRRTLATAGASVVLEGLSLHLAGSFGGERTVITAGGALRF